MSFSFFSKSSTSDSPGAKPDQPKEAEGPTVAKGSFSSLAVPRNSIAYNSHLDKPETEPASTADKSEPAVASASGTTSDSIVLHAGRLIFSRFLLTRSPQSQKRKATHPLGLHLLPCRLILVLLRSAKKPLPRASLSKAIQLRNQIRVPILKKSGNQSPRQQRGSQLILAPARLNASGSSRTRGP